MLFGTGQLTGSVFAYDLEAIRETIEHPEKLRVYKTAQKAVADPQKLLDLVDLNVDPAQFIAGVGETANEKIARFEALIKKGLDPYSITPLGAQLQELKDTRALYINVAKTGIDLALNNLIANFLARVIGNLLSTEVVPSDFDKYPIDRVIA